MHWMLRSMLLNKSLARTRMSWWSWTSKLTPTKTCFNPESRRSGRCSKTWLRLRGKRKRKKRLSSCSCSRKQLKDHNVIGTCLCLGICLTSCLRSMWIRVCTVLAFRDSEMASTCTAAKRSLEKLWMTSWWSGLTADSCWLKNFLRISAKESQNCNYSKTRCGRLLWGLTKRVPSEKLEVLRFRGAEVLNSDIVIFSLY